MTRLLLCTGLCVTTLVVGLVTAIVQSHNREAGSRLNDLREETTLIEAVNDAAEAQVVGADHGPIALEQARAPTRGPAR